MSKKIKESNNFYLDIFNKLLSINEHKIFIVFDKNENIWFCLKDLLLSLGYIDTKNAIKDLNIDVEFITNIGKLQVGGTVPPTIGVQPKTKMINSSGLYLLLGISTKPLAKQFIRHYVKYIMPSITETGKYISNNKDMQKIKKLNHRILELKHNTKTLINNQINIIYPKGSAIYIIKQNYNNKIYYKIGHTINLNTRLHTYNTGAVNKIYYNFYTLIKDSKIDACIKKIMKNEEYIKNKEFYKASLSSIFKFIHKCNNGVKNVCCGYCQKKMSFNIACTHKCKLI
jgi:prophage antirepressor-like protein